MTTEDDGARSARPVGPSETAEAAIPTTPSWHDPDENIIRLWQARGRATAEADRILTLAGDDTDSEAQRHADALDEKATEIEKRIAIMIPNGPTGWAVQVALLALWRERGSRADHLDQRLSERLGAYFLGTVSLLLNTPNGGPAKRRADNPDAKVVRPRSRNESSPRGA